jgi:ADP-ribose pyrophosphatase
MSTISTRTAFHGRVFDVTIERVRLPKGLERDLEVVRHPASVVLIVVPEPGHVVLVKQYRHPVAQWLWELPAGTLEPGEDPDAAARRECEEETGYAPARVERLRGYFPVPGYCDEEMIFYRLEGLTRPESPASPDEDEDLEARTFTVAEARAMAEGGEIRDMKSVLGLLLV